MSAEDRAAQRRIPDDQFNEILRVIRETVREEMRADRDAAKSRVDRSLSMLESIATEQRARLSN